MRIFTITMCVCAAIVAHARSADAYNYIFLRGKDVGGEMLCSDWNRHLMRQERATMIQWVLGFVTGYDAAIRRNLNAGGLNGEPIINFIGDLCKQNPDADLVSIAKHIAKYMQDEIKGDVSPPTILNPEAAAAADQPEPDSWFVVKSTTNNACALVSRPTSENFIILTSFKAFTLGDKAIGNMVTTECGCEKGCSFKLPRR
jgi:hypothetical protein